MKKIKHLSPQVANQIAAGEVIERPASVVKELLENALDAGATQILVEIGFGGLNLIRVSDNGDGIFAEDLVMAIAPHATSKISQIDDLRQIESMGFRGEALASIASISRLTISSKTAHDVTAMCLQNDDQGHYCQMPCARHQGTTVEVLDLFYNTPVRKKFLRTERSEFQAIEHVVKRFAFCAPHIGINLKHNGKDVLSCVAAPDVRGEWLRACKILGQKFADHALSVDAQYGDLHLRGWISSPLYQRSQRDRQWTYLNQRMIQDKLLYHAIQQAYQSVLYPGRYATCLLYLTIPSEHVDVNVHPTKHEVRFQAPKRVHDFLVSVISEKLDEITQPVLIDAFEVSDKTVTTSECDDTYVSQHSAWTQKNHTIHLAEGNMFCLPREPADTMCSKSINLSVPLASPASWYVVNASFVMITVMAGEVYLVHAAHAYQAMCRERLCANLHHISHRPLLIPLKIPVSKGLFFCLERQQALISSFGVEFDFLGRTDIVVRGVPQCLPQLDIKQFFQDLTEQTWSEENMMDQLVACQIFDAHHCDSEEKIELFYFLQQHQFNRKYCRRMDEKVCLETVLYES